MATPTTNPDGKWVVIENGQRVGQLHEDQATAAKEAERLKNLHETKGAPSKPTVSVKQNLLG